MATLEQRLQIIIDAQNKAGGAFSDVSKGLDKVKKGIQSWQPAFKAAAVAGTAALGAITAYSTVAIKGAIEAERVQTRLAHIIKTSTGATDDQIESLNKQAEALERVGVVSADVIRQGQGQLASFDLQAESIENLIPAILNYAVAEKGLNMTSEDLQAVTNGLAQAMQGKFRSLEATGFILDEETKAMISNGTEMERVTALVKVLDSTYGGLNERMRETTEGQLVGMEFAMGRLNDAIGKALLPVVTLLAEKLVPILERFADWAEKNPDLLSKIILTSAAIAGLVTVVGSLGVALPAIITGVQLLGVALGFIAANPIVLVIGALAFLIIKFKELMDVTGGFKEAFIAMGETIIEWWKKSGEWIVEKIEKLIDAFRRLKEKASDVVGGALDKVLGRRAQGGPVSSGGSYLVGERGPEIFTPATAGRISNPGGGSVIINLSGNTFMGREGIAEQIADDLMRTLKDRMKLST